MSIPTGYEKLAVIGIAYKGEYVPGTPYKLLNAVYYLGSTFVALKDDPQGEPIPDGVNWMYLARGFLEGVMSAINVTDTGGVLGQAGEDVNAQLFLDALAERVAGKIDANKIVSNFLSTDPTTVLSGPMGKELMDKFTQLNSDMTDTENNLNTVNAALDPLKSNYINNMDFNTVGKVNLLLWDTNTASTPYKTGNTVYGNGFCITYSSGSSWLTQMAMAVGDSHIFTRHRRDGVWSGWTTIGPAAPSI